MAPRFDLRPRTLAAVGAVSFLLLVASLIVEVQVTVVRPGIGGVDFWTLWRLALGTATIGSFLVAVYRLAAPRREDAARGLEIRGHSHEIEVHLHGDEVAGRLEWSDKTERTAGRESAEEESPEAQSDEEESAEKECDSR